MRLTITEPCIIECDGPIIISPYNPTIDYIDHIQKVKNESREKAIAAEADAPKRRIMKYPSHRKPMPRHNKKCLYCDRTYRGTKQQMYCSNKCKHAWYGNGKKPAPKPQSLNIHAGATGVQTSAD